MANAQSLHAAAVAELAAADAALPSVDEQLTAMSVDESATLSVELAHPHPCPHPRAHALLPISQERSSFSEGASPRTPVFRSCGSDVVYRNISSDSIEAAVGAPPVLCRQRALVMAAQ